jgi:serine phosphatase RsbU (regulator of sigma subunit)
MFTGTTSAELNSLRPSRGRSLVALSRFIPGLRGRLLLAFIAISLFVVAAAVAGLYALREVEQSLDRITIETLPVALDARELLRKSEKIVGIGPALVNASNAKEVEELTSRVRDEQADLSTILARLSAANLDPGALDEISDATTHLNQNLDLMWVAWSDGMGATDRKRRAINEVLAAYREFGNIWRPRFADLNTRIVRLQLAMTSADAGPEERRAAHDQFDQAMAALLALDKIQHDSGDAFELISRAANASDTTEIDSLEPQAQRSMRALDGLVSDVDLDISSELFKPLSGLRSAVTGEGSIFSWVRKATAAKAESRRLVAEDQTLSVRLKMAIDKLVAFSRLEIDSANAEALRVQTVGRNALLAVAALSLGCSFLIVWLYVGRNIVSRLTRLSSSMAVIAGGGRDLIIDTRGADEVSAMGRAVEVFRQHAIERDELLAERAAAAERLEQLVEERTKELNKTVGTLEEAHEVIASSIQYASRIQRSILPETNLVDSTLSDCFILWEPRDVVSGDVYWVARWGDGVLIAVGDCTGHGVPGAFMTLIAYSAFERALIDVESGAVGKLISRMNQLIQVALKQTAQGGESDDGIELGGCYLAGDRTRLTFAGARTSLFSALPGEDLAEIKGDKRGIGYRRTPFDQAYRETCLPVAPGMRFYMTSDGLIDQIGGERHRAFGLTRFLALLNRHQDQPMADQKNLLVNALADYQGEEIRRDDVLVLGVRL